MKTMLKNLSAIIILSVFWLFNLESGNYILLNWLFFVLYFLFTGYITKNILFNYFYFPKNKVRTYILGIFWSLMQFSLISGAFLFFLDLNNFNLFFALIINGLILTIFNLFPKSNSQKIKLENPHELTQTFRGAAWLVVPYLVLWGSGLYLLFQSKTEKIINTPWEVISPYYIYVFLGATLILGILIFSKLKTGLILFLLILHAFLLHSYLPLTHELFYGADGWRHNANTEVLSTGSNLPEVNLSEDKTSVLQKFDIGKLSYTNFYALNIFLNKNLGLNLISITKWLIPILWALIFPLILFELGRSLGTSKKEAGFLVYLSFFPFAIQQAGSFSLPVNFGFLIFLFLVLLFLRRSLKPNTSQLIIIIISGLLLIFGYSLYFILFWILFLVSEIINLNKKINLDFTKKIFYLLLALFLGFIIPIIEIVAKYSYFATHNFWGSLKQFLGNITGFYLATGPREHDILTGNILLNQIPKYNFVSNMFTSWLGWLSIVAILILIFAFTGWVLSLSEKHNRVWLSITSLALFLSYFISRYLLAGENVLARRLDLFLAVLIVLLLFFGIKYIFSKKTNLIINKPVPTACLSGRQGRQVEILIFLIIFSIFTTASYSLGPDSRANGIDNLEAVNYIWKNIDKSQNFCVVSDTYSLLQLEYASSKKIVGGGFPINQYFAQPELVEINNLMTLDPTEEIWNKAFEITNSTECWYVGNLNNLNYNKYAHKKDKGMWVFDKVVVWKKIK